MDRFRRWAAVAAVGAAMALGAAPAARADSPNGPHLIKDKVKAHTTDSYQMTFLGDELAVVTVEGDGGADLELRVLDRDGNVVARVAPSDQCAAGWKPPQTGTFTIKIVNHGDVSHRYTLQTN
jgi:hypothetical protein